MGKETTAEAFAYLKVRLDPAVDSFEVAANLVKWFLASEYPYKSSLRVT